MQQFSLWPTGASRGFYDPAKLAVKAHCGVVRPAQGSEDSPNRESQETIKYGIPTFTLQGNLVHFGAYKKHIGFYATPSGNAEFQQELSAYAGAKGSVQFPIDQPLPLELISKMVKFRVQENLEKAEIKLKKIKKN